MKKSTVRLKKNWEKVVFQYNSEKFANSGTPGDVWYLDGGNVITSMVSVSEFSVVQYQFLHPDVSSEKPES